MTPDELLQRADVALDVAKQHHGVAVVYDDSMEAIRRNLHLRRVELLEAIEADQLVLDYQPTFELRGRRIAGAEALVRWNHPQRGRLLPEEFVPFAERTGLIGPVSRWVLARVVADLTAADLPPNFTCALNLPVHLLDDPALLRALEEHLARVPRLAQHLAIEVTESEAMQNVERSIQSLESMRRLGLRIAIDDFGTGYSSMAYLKRLPIDVVKIDRSFVHGIPKTPEDVAIAQMFLRLTKQLRFVSLAEGIETEEQANWLRKNGCVLGQGFLVAKPQPFADLLARLEAASVRAS